MTNNTDTTTETTETNVTSKEIRALQYEAGCHGDEVTVALCRRALEGDAMARQECVEIILDARAEHHAE